MSRTSAKTAAPNRPQQSSVDLEATITDLLEELRLSRALNAGVSEPATDSILHWQGRNRFLTERTKPVRLELSTRESFQPELGSNRIVDGDNLSVMTSLLTEFRGGSDRGFDIIYIDPPYNTGEDVFAYNDDFSYSSADVKRLRKKTGRAGSLVSLDDPNRHTKWINHIAPRLWVARKLLRTTGVLIASIDEHELPRMWMLLEEMFGEKNRIATLIWQRSRKNDANYVSEGHEYMLVWARDKSQLDASVRTKGKWRETKPGLEEHLERFYELAAQHPHDNSKVEEGLKASVKGVKKGNPLWTIRQYVHVDNRSRKLGPFKEEDLSWPKQGGPKYKVISQVTGRPVKIPAKGWRIDKTDMNRLIEDERVAWKGTGIPKSKKYLLEGRETDVFPSVIEKDARQATMMSKAIFGFEDAYNHPKDHLMLKRLFNLVTWNKKDALILDPYAGSGTTAHSVVEMNAEDGGTRRFVLIEGGLVSESSKIKSSDYTRLITARRVRSVISGEWADKKEHPRYSAGFNFYRATEEVSRKSIMASTRETLSDLILQVVEEDSNRVDCRVQGHSHLIGRTKLGYGIALVWQLNKKNEREALTMPVLEAILDEGELASVKKPIHVYATANVAPLAQDLYRFHQIPNSILARLGILEDIET